MTAASETPRTDAAKYKAFSMDGEGNPLYNEHDVVEADFASELERELAAVRGQLADANKRAYEVKVQTDEVTKGLHRAAIEAETALAAAKEGIAALMIKHGMATGHGDTCDDLLRLMDAELAAAKAELARERCEREMIEQKLDRDLAEVRGQFTEWRDGEWKRMLDARNVRDPCKNCGGIGVYCYGDTSIWRRTGGGQMLTAGVCDKCWGSGDATHTWVDLRKASAELAAAKAALAQERCEREMIEQKLDRELAAAKDELRKVGAMIPMAGGGTFENDPPDAIVDALKRHIDGIVQLLESHRQQYADKCLELIAAKAEAEALRVDAERLRKKHAGIITNLNVGDYVQVRYADGSGILKGTITKIWPDLDQAQVNDGWCFHPKDSLEIHIPKSDAKAIRAEIATKGGK